MLTKCIWVILAVFIVSSRAATTPGTLIDAVVPVLAIQPEIASVPPVDITPPVVDSIRVVNPTAASRSFDSINIGPVPVVLDILDPTNLDGKLTYIYMLYIL